MHDSLDYNSLKISVFSEDKRTDLIGDAWVNLSDIIIPGGGKCDLWQGLNCKGKYAGELRLELTYYDERPKPEVAASVVEDARQASGYDSRRVTRRPLHNGPTNGDGRHVTPDTIPQLGPPGRTRHGPRDLMAPPRTNSMPPEVLDHSPAQGHAMHQHVTMRRRSDAPPGWQAEFADPYAQHMEPEDPPPPPPPMHSSTPYAHGSAPQSRDHHVREPAHWAPPRPLSYHSQAPSPNMPPSSSSRPRSVYSIQNPVRAFESSDDSPLASASAHRRPLPTSTRSTPARKSISPGPSPGTGAGAGALPPRMPFCPDSFDVHNPHAQQQPAAAATPNAASPHTPFAVRPGAEPAASPHGHGHAHDTPPHKGPIVDWHGHEVDPSDHLPVEAWAPEPEKKVPAKTYGRGRDRDFGPRAVHSSPAGRDMLQLRMKPASASSSPSADASHVRARLHKKRASHTPGVTGMAGFDPVDPVGHAPYAPHQRPGAENALAREISTIDIGGSRRRERGVSVPATLAGGVPAAPAPAPPSQVAFVPVRSHKDRRTYY